MDRKLLTLNILYAIADVIIGLAGIAVFDAGAWFFGKWWLLCFTLLPLLLYNNHTLVINEDIHQQEDSQRGGEDNTKER